MKIIAINGSPRKEWNTAQALVKTLEGAASQGAETELIHLYDLKFQGCVSCFACKRKDRPHGVCALRDDLSPILEKLKEADAVVFGSPIYLMGVSSGMFALFERFVFSNMIYSMTVPTVYPKRTPSALIYTMNITDEQAGEIGLNDKLAVNTGFLERVLGVEPEVLNVCNTYQFTDYSKFESSMFDEADKAAYRERHFPQDLQAAYDIGVSLIRKAVSLEPALV